MSETGPSGPRRCRALPLGANATTPTIRRDSLAALLWPVPAMFALAALVAAVATAWLDQRLQLEPGLRRLIVDDTDTAVTLTSVVASGMLAFLAIVFSTTLVAIQLAGSQYSPRAVRVFVRSRVTKATLGIFIGTFIFAVATLVDVRAATATQSAFVPLVSMLTLSVLILATVAMFLTFVHSTSRLLRVQYLVERIALDATGSMLRAFPPADRYVTVAEPDPAPGAQEVTTGDRHGVVEAVHVGRLGRIATSCGGWVELTVPVGTYVAAGTPVALVHGSRPAEPGEVVAALRLGTERTLVQDPGFGVRQLVDIAVRALSPGVNDPTTAAQVLDRLTDVFVRIAGRADPTGWYADDAGIPRVKLPAATFDDLLRLGFVEIIRYGADSPQVVRRTLAALERIALDPDPQRRASVEALGDRLRRAAEAALPPAVADTATEPDPRGIG